MGADELASAYRACLELCDQLGAQSVAFPGISLGIYGFPMNGARIAVETVAAHLRGETKLMLARFVLRPDTFAAFERACRHLAR